VVALRRRKRCQSPACGSPLTSLYIRYPVDSLGSGPMLNAVVARRNMVECQIRPNKVTDLRVIEAFEAVPRERFVPDALAGVAYVDEDLPIAPGRYLIEPMVIARLIQALALEPDERVLDVATGYGYAAAVMARLAQSVVALESDAALVEGARRALAGAQVANVTLAQGDLAKGHAAGAPYDAILVGGALERVPAELTAQLAEGGRLAAVLVEGGVGRASLFVRAGGVVSHRALFEAGTPRLPGFAAPTRFVF
jgi:protein-L-isoaspartate(D-aspartate) O-methyltransferase